jgi:UDP-N-acetylglucosamine:LPS N-acetylglucosamine transferase
MLYKTILEVLQNPERLARMSEAARAQAHPDAAARIADMLEEIGG